MTTKGMTYKAFVRKFHQHNIYDGKRMMTYRQRMLARLYIYKMFKKKAHLTANRNTELQVYKQITLRPTRFYRLNVVPSRPERRARG